MQDHVRTKLLHIEKSQKWRLVARSLLIGFHYRVLTINGPFYARAARSGNGCINALHGLRGGQAENAVTNLFTGRRTVLQTYSDDQKPKIHRCHHLFHPLPFLSECLWLTVKVALQAHPSYTACLIDHADATS